MVFNKLYCNGNINPVGISKNIRLTWNYSNTGRRNETQTAFQIFLDSSEGKFDSGIIKSNNMCYNLSDYYDIRPGIKYNWKLNAYNNSGMMISSTVQFFETAIDDLDKTCWLTCDGEDVSSPVFEKSFSISKNVLSARAYVTGLGLIYCKCNTQSCSDNLLMPPNTVYDKFLYMETFDITALLKKGENSFSINLGNGYNRDYSQFGYRYFNKKGCCAAILIKYEDSSEERIDTDESWYWYNSNIKENGLYEGETYDASVEDFQKRKVSTDDVLTNTKIIADEMPHIKVIKELVPTDSWISGDGEVFDFGCNIQGITEITVEASEGTIIRLLHSEMIHPDGILDTETNRAAKAEDKYICCGEGTEVYRPTFTYHGFRYVFVSWIGSVRSFSLKALQISSDVEHGSSFICSDAAINRVHSLCLNSMRSNMVSIPTDCPVRDERTPCQMDSQMYEHSAIYNFNMYLYYMKWLNDIVNTTYRKGEENPDWHGDYITLAYRIYKYYGDLEPISRLYDRIVEDVNLWIDKSENGVISTGFGDWCLPNDNTWGTVGECKAAVNTSLLYFYCTILEEISPLIGKSKLTEDYGRWKNIIKSGYYNYCIEKYGSLYEARQPEIILPLYFGLFDGAIRKEAESALIDKIKSTNHLDTGGFGTMALIPAVAAAGGINLIPGLLQEGSYPGFGFWMVNGATSLWEQWAVKGIMHSHSHAMYSGIDASFYNTICGIKPAESAFRKITIDPVIPDNMQFCSCRLQTVSGDIEVSLERLYHGLEISITIPPNVSAVLHIPEYNKYDNCSLFDGERKTEKKQDLNLGGGYYRFRLVPDNYIK